MLVFAIGLSIGLFIMTPLIAMVLVAGAVSRRTREGEAEAPRSRQDVRAGLRVYEGGLRKVTG